MNLTPHIPHSVASNLTAPEWAAQVVRAALFAGDIAEAEYLRQDEIARALRISKIPVREALRLLAGEGLVVFLPNRGVVAASLSARESAEIVEMRIALETLALRLAVPRLAKREIRRASRILEDLDEELTGSVQSEGNWAFHRALYGAADRPLLLETIRGLHMRVDRYMRVVLSELKHHRRSQKEHRELLMACSLGDADAATSLLEAHIRLAGEALQGHLAPRELQGGR